MAALDLLSVVALLEDYPASGLVRGQVGTVVEILAPDTVLVDFSDQEGHTYAIEPIRNEMLMRFHHLPLERVA